MLGGKSVADNNRLIDYAGSQVHARNADHASEKGDEESRIDFLSRLVGVEDKKTSWHPTFADLGTESLNMMMAGADPFSSVLAGTLFYLVHNPQTLAKATQEVRYVQLILLARSSLIYSRSTFPSPSAIVNSPDLTSCTYLYACIEEALRRTAPVPSHLPRVVLPGGMTIDSQHFPADTVVGVPMYAIHHSETYFPAPFTFQPERWLESASNSAEDIALARKAFNPFSIGTRQCSGRALAYLQLKLTLAHLLWRFDMRIAEGEEGVGAGKEGLGVGRERQDEFQLWDALGFGRDGPVLEFKTAER